MYYVLKDTDDSFHIYTVDGGIDLDKIYVSDRKRPRRGTFIIDTYVYKSEKLDDLAFFLSMEAL